MESSNIDYNSFIKSIEIKNILLDSLKSKRYSDLKKGSNLDVNLSPEFSIKRVKKGELLAIADFHILITNDDESKVFQIDIRYLIHYTYAPEITVTDDIKSRFIRTNIPVNSWPYARELISQMSTKMGYPPLIIPAFKVM